MELRLYWHIVRRRSGVILLLLLVVLASYVGFRQEPALSYTANMRFVVGIQPEPGAGSYYTYDRYYTWLTAEYLIDDLSEVVKSHAFAARVGERAGLSGPVGAIQGATSAGKLHRILSVSVTWPDPVELESLADAVVAVLREEGHTFFAQLSTERGVIALIDPPTVAQVGPSLRQRLDLPLRLALALAAGIGLAFLLDYLDDCVRGPADLQAIGLDTLGCLPPAARWRDRWPLRGLGRRDTR